MVSADRAVKALSRCFRSGSTNRIMVERLLRVRGGVDVSSLEGFVGGDNSAWVRADASRVVASKGRSEVVVDAAREELEPSVLREMLGALGARGEGPLEELAFLLCDEERPGVKQMAIRMFKEAGRSDCMMPLLLSSSKDEVAMAKRCINGR